MNMDSKNSAWRQTLLKVILVVVILTVSLFQISWLFQKIELVGLIQNLFLSTNFRQYYDSSCLVGVFTEVVEAYSC